MKKTLVLGTVLCTLLFAVRSAYAQVASPVPAQSDFEKDVSEGEQSIAHDQQEHVEQKNEQENEHIGIDEDGQNEDQQLGVKEQDKEDQNHDEQSHTHHESRSEHHRDD